MNHIKLGLFTYECICVEFNISKGLPDKLILQWKGSRWTQKLDYKNTSFQYWIFQQVRHLHIHVPKYELILKEKKKGHKPKQKGWQSFKQQLPDNEKKQNAENQQTTISEKDRNGCLEVQVLGIHTLQ